MEVTRQIYHTVAFLPVTLSLALRRKSVPESEPAVTLGVACAVSLSVAAAAAYENAEASAEAKLDTCNKIRSRRSRVVAQAEVADKVLPRDP